MSTRSYIAIQEGKKYTTVYCHSDGYLAYNGNMLLSHYSNPIKVRELISLGDLSVLGKEIGTKHDFNDLGIRLDGDICTFYGRDRQETNTGAIDFNSYFKLVKYFRSSMCAYLYIYNIKNNQWYYKYGNEKIKLLTQSAIENGD